MSEPELTPLQQAQKELLCVGVARDTNSNAHSAQANGLLLSCRLSALVELVGQGSPDFQKLFDEECLSQVKKLTEQIKTQMANQSRIALAS